MQLRLNRTSRNGKTYEYAQLVESYRRESDGMPMHRVVANLGSLSELEIQNLRTTIKASRNSKRVVVARATKPAPKALPKILANRRYLDAAVLLALWDEWKLTKLLGDLLPKGAADVEPALVVAALAIQRSMDPGSKLFATRWFPTSALPELLGVSPSAFNNTRVHRVLDELDAASEALMGKLPVRYQEHGGAFVSLLLDTTDTWFVGHGPQLAARAKTKEGRMERKIGIVLLCDQRGYPLRWEVIHGRESEVTAMSRMADLVGGLSWARCAPFVCDRAMGHTAQIRHMLAAGLRFVTALTRNEYGAYTDRIPHRALADFELHRNPDQHNINEASRIIEEAGLQRIDDSLFVLDLGIVERDVQDVVDQAPVEQSDALAKVMQLARSIEQGVAAGRYASRASASRALGMTKQTGSVYCKLTALPESVQQQILEGKASGWPLQAIMRIVRLADPQQQCEAFADLIAGPKPRRASANSLGVVRGNPGVRNSRKPRATSGASHPRETLRVRAALYFNPQMFVDQRRRAHNRIEAIRGFVKALNTRLAGAQSRMTREQVAATVDRRLRRDDLLETFAVDISEHHIGKQNHYRVKLTLKETQWAHRRRYDGFAIVVAHPNLELSATQLCRLYRDKDTVEKDFQVIKSFIDLRPVRHQNNGKVRAHVTICMLALLLERTLKHKLKGKYTAEAAMEALKGCHLNQIATADDGLSTYTLTETTPEQAAILRLLRLQALADQEQVADRITPR